MRILVRAVFLLVASISLAAGTVEFKLVTQKTVTDAQEIATFRNELLLGTEQIDRIVITDALNDGFDENDFIQLYPSGRVVRIQRIETNLDALLQSYSLPPNVEIHETKQFYTRYDSTARRTYGGQALGYGLLGGIAERLYRGYRGNSMEGYFKMSPSGMSIQAWNFDSTKVGFPPPDAPRVDTFYVYLHDTIMVPEVVTVNAEPIVVRDTVYIPSELLKKRSGFFYREALGMIGGGYNSGLRESSRGRVTLGAGNEWDFGVWDRWISGRQDVDSRMGLRFVADMAPWKSDTLSPRFLASSFEAMYIPAWDGRYFAFGGVRAFYHDDLFWDRARAGWDEDIYTEPTFQKLAQYEITGKVGLDKLSISGSGKRIGVWLKASGWINSTDHSAYDVVVDGATVRQFYSAGVPMPFHWEQDGGTDVELGLNARLAESAQLVLSAGDFQIPNLHYEFADLTISPEPRKGLLHGSQLYQMAAFRVSPINEAETRLMLEVSFRNNTFTSKVKQGTQEQLVEDLFFPYFETPELTGMLKLDLPFARIDAGAQYLAPPQNLDPQVRFFGGLYFMVR